ncbi:hypothetical protein [Methanobrevibacter filiformis]|uniref:Uncharacterized protein n=1 Tax=Methanobrevibacter filiformis TaxID=55758 RepID=A0A166AH76_9EURY|nr:hypothetical protein [Methanobrevibacter filiformis]KZX12028.1 hypothetical protein MBFIL_12600 [Methanobrevibacter filiformis]
MVFELKYGIIQRDSLDESFQLLDSNNYFANDDLLIAIDSDTLVTIELLLKTILSNDFKKWNEVLNSEDIDSISKLFIKLGYEKEDLVRLINDI